MDARRHDDGTVSATTLCGGCPMSRRAPTHGANGSIRAAATLVPRPMPLGGRTYWLRFIQPIRPGHERCRKQQPPAPVRAARGRMASKLWMAAILPQIPLTRDHRRLAPNQVPRPRPGAHGLHLRACRLQPHPLAEARGKNRMIEAAAAVARRETMSLHIREAHTTIRSQRSLCGNPKPDYASSSAMVTIPSACELAIQVRHACSLRASATRASDLERGYGRRMVPCKNLNTLISTSCSTSGIG